MSTTQTQEERYYRLSINYYKCVGCGDCQASCPVNQDMIRLKGYLDESDAVIYVKNANVFIVNERLCTGCGSCIPVCPVRAIDILMKEP
jgi:ferredoxin